MTNFLEYLKESPDCLYIYNRDFSIYGLPSKERYTIVVKDSWVVPDELSDYNEAIFEIYPLQEWFKIVLSGNLIGWECACLNKKYVIKEYVKLLMTTNPIQLRKDIDSEHNLFHLCSNPGSVAKKLIRDIKFSIQIILNHKIVNYKDGLGDFYVIDSFETPEECYQYVDEVYAELKSLTDGMLKQEILKKANAREL
jgi:hypothetical protein